MNRDAELEKIKDIMKLNNVSEAEELLVMQLSQILQMLGWSRDLACKIMQTLVDCLEVSKEFRKNNQ